MISNSIRAFLAMGPSPAGPGQTPTAPGWVNFLPLVLMVFVFYFVFIRPQQKKAKDLQSLLGSLKSGDKVVTSSGIVGTVVTVKDRTVSLRSADTKIEVLKSAIAEITERGASDASESKS